MSDTFGPVGDGLDNKCFISKSYDESSHFKTAADDVLDLYCRITGQVSCCTMRGISLKLNSSTMIHDFAQCTASSSIHVSDVRMLPLQELDMSIDPHVPQPGDY